MFYTQLATLNQYFKLTENTTIKEKSVLILIHCRQAKYLIT